MAAGAAFFEQRAELAVETARQRARVFHVRGAEGLGLAVGKEGRRIVGNGGRDQALQAVHGLLVRGARIVGREVQHREAGLGGRPAQGLEDLLLVAEVVVDEGLGHAQGLDDLLHRGVGVAVAVEQGLGRLEDAFALFIGAGRGKALAAARGDRGLGHAGNLVSRRWLRWLYRWVAIFYQRVYIGKTPIQKSDQGYPLGLVPGWPDTQETSMADSETLIPLHEALRRNARNHPGRDAYIWYGRHISWAEVDAASDAFAARLQALGVGRGEPVALFMNNCPQYIVAHYGIQKIGAIVCPCGPLNKEHELQYQLDDLKARVIVAADVLLPVVDKVRASTALRHVLAVRYGDWLPESATLALPPELLAPVQPLPEGVESFWDVMHSGAKPVPVDVAMDDVSLMTYTSGTTGLPKGAMLSYGNAASKTAGASSATGVNAGDMLLAVAPLYHIAGMSMGVNMPVHSGATCVLLHRFDPLAVAQALERYRVTWWYSIAPMNVAVMQLPGVEAMDFSALRRNTVTSFGIAYTEELARQWKRFTPNCISSEARSE